MSAITPIHPKSVTKSMSAALELKSLARKVPAHPAKGPLMGLFQRMFRREEPSIFHRCLAIHMHNAAQPSALNEIRW